MPPNVVSEPISFPTPVKEAGDDPAVPQIQHEAKTVQSSEQPRAEKVEGIFQRKDIIWRNVFFITLLHIIAIYGFMTVPYIRKWKTFLWGNYNTSLKTLAMNVTKMLYFCLQREKKMKNISAFAIGMSAAFGVTGGIHRFWTHKAYKANIPLRIILTICYLAAGQNSMYNWVRDHRVHHKYSETDADPHNANRGFFFSHVGWLMVRKHPEVIRRGRQIDMSDLVNDPVAAFCERCGSVNIYIYIKFEINNSYFRFIILTIGIFFAPRRHFTILKLFVCFIIPICVPVYFWNEEWYYAILFQISRYTYVLNATWSVNSFAHFFGNKPYDK